MIRSPVARLSDILEAIKIVQGELVDTSLSALLADRRKQWIVERGIEIISEASRHLPDAVKARHPDLPWRRIAGIGNVLRHEYASIAHDVLWSVARDDLPPLMMVCQAELLRASASLSP